MLSGWLLTALFGAGTLVGAALHPATAVAQEKAAGAGASAPSSDNTTAPQSESLLGWLYRTLGLRYVLAFLFITFNLVALVVMNLLAVRREAVMPASLVANIEAGINDRRLQEVYDLVQQDDSVLGRVLTAALSKAQSGYDPSLAALQIAGEDESLRYEQRIGWVALIAQIAPMVGLLGTVDGMVMAFEVIAHSNTTPKPSALAQGIGTALVTTLVGLIIAIPTLAFHHFIRNRITRLIFEVGMISEDLLKRFFAAATAPAATATPPAPPARKA